MSVIYINKRPIKVAFIIDPQQSDWQEQIDAIWHFCQEKWGGKYNPIVPTNGKALDENWWRFLEILDPDYVISVSPLDDGLVEEIRRRIRPIEVELPKQSTNDGQKPQIFTYNHGIPVYPNTSTIAKFQTMFSNNVLAAIRGIRWSGDSEIFRFLLQNFGIFEEIYYLDRILEKVENKELFKANNVQELAAMLTSLARHGVDFVYPIQFSMLQKPPWFLELENEHAYDNFGLIIGDTFQEQLFFRNKIFFERDSSHNRIRHLWLSKSLYDNDEFMQALGEWLRRATQEVHMFSFSLSETELLSIGAKLDVVASGHRPFNDLRKAATSYSEFPSPKFPNDHRVTFWDRFSHPISPPKNCEFVRSNQLADSFSLESPSQLEGFSDNGYWMAEVYVEADKSRFYHRKEYLPETGTFWWQLPRKNYLARDIFRTNARVNYLGIPVIQLPGQNPVLNVKLPNEVDLVRSCLLGDRKGRMLGAIERKTFEIDHTEASNIGNYLSGFLEVFGGLALAHGYLEERYWRDMFDIMSGREQSKRNNLLVEVRNKLGKKIRADRTKEDIVKNYESLAEYVVRLSHEVAFDGKELRFKDLLKAKIAEHKAFKKHHALDYPFDTSALRKSMSKLLELGVLQMGLSQKCPRCGSVNWFSIDEARQSSVCAGCRYQFSLHANPDCSYRLSSLARRGISAHGLVPVALVLGQMLEDARSSFFFGPCMDLFTVEAGDPPKYTLITDSDIVCIKDGKFIIGEIKLSQNQFTLQQMQVMATVAETIEADVLLFSSLDNAANSRTVEMIEKIKIQLGNSHVDVGWYQLDVQMFDPSRGDC